MLFVFCTVLLVIILLLIVIIICYHYSKHRSKLKTYCCAKSIKIENNEFLKVCIENRMCYYSDDIIKFEDFDFDNILIDKKSLENILIYDVSYKTLIETNPLHISFDKIDGIIRIYNGNRY